MKLECEIAGKVYGVDLANAIDLAIPLCFDGAQPNHFDAPEATARPFESGSFVGDTRRGGSCNVEEYRLIPHCNGTHTECVGHISHERISLHRILRNALIPATLITVTPEPALACADSYLPAKQKEDWLVTREQLSKHLQARSADFLRGLIIRTSRHEPAKKSRRYAQHMPAFFSREAMALVASLGVQHLLVDLPSVDRMFDEGRLSAHHVFWNVPQGSQNVDENHPSLKTITEMIYIDDSVSDGEYLLNLQTPSFVADAAPSRPVIYPIVLL